jgi:hypothetical protein
MWIVFEQGPGYPPQGAQEPSYPDLGSTGVRYLPTRLCFSKVVEKKEENVVFNRIWAALSTNPILIH